MARQMAARVGTFVGKVAGTRAYVAIAAASGDVVALVTNGTRLLRRRGTILEWFSGPRSGNRVSLKSESGARLQVSLRSGGATGNVTLPDGTTHELTTEPATGDAGLYRARGEIAGVDVLGGWVLLEDGSVRGATSARSLATDCRNLKNALNRLFVKVMTGDFTLDDLDAGVQIHDHIVNMGC